MVRNIFNLYIYIHIYIYIYIYIYTHIYIYIYIYINIHIRFKFNQKYVLVFFGSEEWVIYNQTCILGSVDQ